MADKTRAAKRRVYGKRVFAVGEEITNDTRISGLNNNDLIIGTAGRGKTGGYVIPNIQCIDGSLVVSDTKRQLYKRFGRDLKGKGYKVYTLDLVEPENSCSFNPLSYIRRRKDGRIREQDIITLSRVICPFLDMREPIWDMCAQNYMEFLIGFCLETEQECDQNMITVAELHRRYNQINGDIPFIEWVMDHPDSFASKKYKELKANQNAEKMWASVMGFVNIDLEPFSFKESELLFKENSFDIAELGRNKTVLFINTSDTDRAFDNIANIFYTQAMQVLCAEADSKPDGRLEVPVRLILDDFAAGSRIPDFDKLISVIRSRDISVSIILQSLSQLDTLYDHSMSVTVVDNCDNILYLGGRDMETARFVANAAGRTPESVFSMPIDKAYLIRGGEKARLVQKIVPYSTVDDYEPR